MYIYKLQFIPYTPRCLALILITLFKISHVILFHKLMYWNTAHTH